MMRRREFIAGLGGAAAWPVAARAQQGERVRRVGVLMSFHDDDPDGRAEIAALRRGLVERGWIDGQTIEIVVRWAGGNIQLIDAGAKDLVGIRPDVLVSRSTPTTAALSKESRIIPLVFVNVTAPVEQGLVQSLARPGENITGFTNFETSVGGKMLQLLKEIAPQIGRAVVIYNPETAPFAGLYMRSLQSAASNLGVNIMAMPVWQESDIEVAMMPLARQPGGGLVVIPDIFTFERRDLIVALAARMRLPAIYGNPYFARGGGLLVYGVDSRDLIHRAADYIDRILKGAKPGELPVQQPTRFQLIVNMNTVRELGLTVPNTLLVSADEVIE
jgi:putative ABC transport system substrate-binding protein